MSRLLAVAAFLLFSGCTDSSRPSDAAADAADGAQDASDGSASDASDGALDAMTDSSVDASPDAAPCVCVGVSTCCDGCHARSVGLGCPNANACLANSTCLANGTCSPGGVLVCPPPPEPQCQLNECSLPGGCAVRSFYEGDSCDDGLAGTFDDHCDDGVCVGTPCACTEGVCCDGCHFRPASYRCITNKIIGPATCATASASGVCPSYPHTQITSPLGDRYCSGTSSLCEGLRVNSGGTVTDDCEVLDPDGLPSSPSNPLRCAMVPADPLGARCRRWCAP